jgi:SAM-dependent methyltransferase
MKKLNLGCENEYLDGWVNLDLDKKVRADVYHNLDKFPYPFKDNEFDEILASHILEHVSDLDKTMKELYRITKDRGLIYINSPHFSDPQKWSEFSHKHCFSYITFGEWFCNKDLYPLFEIVKKKISFTRINFKFMNKILNPIINLNPLIYERMFSGILPSAVIVYILRIRKDKEFQDKKLAFMKKMESGKVDNLAFIKSI